jgi:hypothetical protein
MQIGLRKLQGRAGNVLGVFERFGSCCCDEVGELEVGEGLPKIDPLSAIYFCIEIPYFLGLGLRKHCSTATTSLTHSIRMKGKMPRTTTSWATGATPQLIRCDQHLYSYRSCCVVCQ